MALFYSSSDGLLECRSCEGGSLLYGVELQDTGSCTHCKDKAIPEGTPDINYI